MIPKPLARVAAALGLAFVLAAGVHLATPAHAAPPADAPAAVAGSAPVDAFQAPSATDLSRYKEEPVPGGALLVAAYLVLWVLVGLFVARLLLKQSRLEATVRALEDRIEPGGETP